MDQTGAQQGDSYEEIQLTENGSWLVNGVYLAKKNGKWNLYSEAGEQQGALDADEVDLNRGNGLAFAKDGKWGFINGRGTQVIDYLLVEAGYFDANGKCPAKMDGNDTQVMLSWRVKRS